MTILWTMAKTCKTLRTEWKHEPKTVTRATLDFTKAWALQWHLQEGTAGNWARESDLSDLTSFKVGLKSHLLPSHCVAWTKQCMLSTCLVHINMKTIVINIYRKVELLWPWGWPGGLQEKARPEWLTSASETSLLLIQFVLPASVVILYDICLHVSCWRDAPVLE